MGIARFWVLLLAVFVDVGLVPEGVVFLGFITYVVGAGRPVPAGLPDLGRFGSSFAPAAVVVLVLTWLSLLVLWGPLCPSRLRHLPPPWTGWLCLLRWAASVVVAVGVASVPGVATSVIVLPGESRNLL